MKRSESQENNDNVKKPKKAFFAPLPRIVHRIREYINGNSHLKVIDVDCIVLHLQDTYKEYERKKRSSFRIHVQRVCDHLCLLPRTSTSFKTPVTQSDLSRSNQSYSSDSDVIVASSSDEFSDNNANYATYEDTNLMNRSLINMYKNPQKSQEKSFASSCIDISDGEAKEDRSLLEFPDTINISEVIGSEVIGSEVNNSEKNPILPTSFSTPSTSKLTKKKTPKSLDEKIESAIKNKLEKNLEQSTVRLKDIGGYENTIKEVIKLLIHLKHPIIYEKIGVAPPRGFLLHGPPGCGKTLLVYAIAGELDLPFLKVAATEMVSGVSGESEERLRELFKRAIDTSPCILFIDEIDAITPKRETAQKEMERRIVAQLLACLDDLTMKENASVLVIGATNRPDSLDPALRRAGRFDREIKMGIPDEISRIRILQILCRKLKLSPEFTYKNLARQTPGFVGADLQALIREAGIIALDRILTVQVGKHEAKDDIKTPPLLQEVSLINESENMTESLPQITNYQSDIEMSLRWLKNESPLDSDHLENLCIEISDFEQALKLVQPSAMREGFATIPDVTWDDIGALTDIREELEMAILTPVRHPELFSSKMATPPGILLCGPSGCGKTLLAKAIANESGINFISVKGPELLNMYVGESERAVRQVFQRAQNSAPCVIFFDELDALCPNRSSRESGSRVQVVNQMLTEMDGLETRRQVFVIGATNRPDIIDTAMLRPGRLDKILYVGLPTANNRIDILKALTKNGTEPLLAKDIQLEKIATDDRCDRFSGADLAALVKEAFVVALKKFIDHKTSTNAVSVSDEDFDKAFSKIKPSVSIETLKMFETMTIRRNN